jgi:hypothetical protein
MARRSIPSKPVALLAALVTSVLVLSASGLPVVGTAPASAASLTVSPPFIAPDGEVAITVTWSGGPTGESGSIRLCPATAPADTNPDRFDCTLGFGDSSTQPSGSKTMLLGRSPDLPGSYDVRWWSRTFASGSEWRLLARSAPFTFENIRPPAPTPCTGASGPATDNSVARVRAIEVTQIIQDWKNSVPLHANKPTVVRVFLDRDASDVVGPTTVRLCRGTEKIQPVDTRTVDVLPVAGIQTKRNTLRSSVNFLLPPSWIGGGTLAFSVVASADQARLRCGEPVGPRDATPAGDCAVSVPLAGPGTARIKFLHLQPSAFIPGGFTAGAAMGEQIRRVATAFPVARLDLQNTRQMQILGMGDTPNARDAESSVRGVRMLDMWFCKTNCPPADTIYAGVLFGEHPGIDPLEGNFDSPAGIGTPGQTAVWYTDAAVSPSSTHISRWRGVHEVAHAYAIEHAVDPSLGTAVGSWLPIPSPVLQGRCDEFADVSAPGHFPFATVGGVVRPLIGPIDRGVDNEIWGVDPGQIEGFSDIVGDPRRDWDVMSYCFAPANYRWMSQDVYAQLQAKLGAAREAALSTTRLAVGDYLLLRARFRGQKWAMQPVTRITGTPQAPATGDFRIEALAADGTLIAGQSVRPDLAEPDAAPGSTPRFADASVAVPIPVPGRPIATLRLLRNGAEVAKAQGSPNAPTVNVTTPGPIAGSTATFNWTGSDPDGGSPTYTVVYSADGGNSWTALAVDTTSNSMTVPTSSLPPSESALFQVIASDATSATAATSGPFRVPPQSGTPPPGPSAPPGPTPIPPSGLPPIPSGKGRITGVTFFSVFDFLFIEIGPVRVRARGPQNAETQTPGFFNGFFLLDVAPGAYQVSGAGFLVDCPPRAVTVTEGQATNMAVVCGLGLGLGASTSSSAVAATEDVPRAHQFDRRDCGRAVMLSPPSGIDADRRPRSVTVPLADSQSRRLRSCSVTIRWDVLQRM